jgi:hypothetical protein
MSTPNCLSAAIAALSLLSAAALVIGAPCTFDGPSAAAKPNPDRLQTVPGATNCAAERLRDTERVDIEAVAQPTPQPLIQGADMNFTTRLVVTSLLSTFAGLAMAQDAEQPSSWMTPSTKSRAEVRAEFDAARRAGTVYRDDASTTVAASSSLTRTQVQAEAREAQRLGLIPVNEGGLRMATATEKEQVRLAGQRAAENSQPYATK